MTYPGLLLRGADVEGAIVDVLVRGDRIAAVGGGLRAERDDQVIECRGGALIPGLHDHHIHVLSAAAAAASVRLGPPEVTDKAGFEEALCAAATGARTGDWIRAIGYHESVAGDLDRRILDGLVSTNPVRIQHRSGALWILNSNALEALGIQGESGRMYGADETIGRRMRSADPPRLTALGATLASYGVTGMTDATPSSEMSPIETIAAAVAAGELHQNVVVTGGPSLASSGPVAGIEWGPVKIVIADHDLPDPTDVAAAIVSAHGHGRPVAIHSVTAVSLAIALAAWDEAGTLTGDRVEHGSIISLQAAGRLAEMGLVVVTQPSFVAERGDHYLAEVDESEQADLYRCATLLGIGVGVGGSTDVPFGNPDPWLAISAAVNRRTKAGVLLGGGERLGAGRALELFLSPPDRPGGPPRRVAPSRRADLCLLDAPLTAVLATPACDHVVSTITDGQVVFRRQAPSGVTTSKPLHLDPQSAEMIRPMRAT